VSMKKEIEIIEHNPAQKKADPNSADLVLDGEVEAAQDCRSQDREEFSWLHDEDCIVVKHQPTIAVYWNRNDGIIVRQEDFFGYGDQIVVIHSEFAQKVAKAILTLAKRAK
jgi:hypothetical protein